MNEKEQISKRFAYKLVCKESLREGERSRGVASQLNVFNETIRR